MRRENEAGTQGDLSNNGGDYAGKNEEASRYEKSWFSEAAGNNGF